MTGGEQWMVESAMSWSVRLATMKTLADWKIGNSCLPDEWPEGAYEDTDAANFCDGPDLCDNGEDE